MEYPFTTVLVRTEADNTCELAKPEQQALLRSWRAPQLYYILTNSLLARPGSLSDAGCVKGTASHVLSGAFSKVRRFFKVMFAVKVKLLEGLRFTFTANG